MEYLLYCSAAAIYRGPGCNDGIDEVLQRVEDFQRRGIALRVIDTATMTDQELQTVYIQAIVPSVWKKYRIRGVFGTHRYAGCKFGRSVPALLIHDPTGNRVGDVFPHEEAGRIVTIRDALMKATELTSSIDGTKTAKASRRRAAT